ncbi:MAG: hypothetical protein ACRDXX_03485 [Stackebrandtia sp.]
MVTHVNDPASIRPGALSAGVFTVFLAAVGGLAASGMLLALYNSLVSVIPADDVNSDETAEMLTYLQSFSIVVVIGNGLLAVGMVIGALMALRANNVGRILIWTIGGANLAWHWCCSGYGGFVRLVIVAAEQDTGDTVSDHFPVWQLDVAVIAGFVSGTAALVAIILIALTPVNKYFRALKPPPGGYAAPAGYGPPGGPYYGPPR